MAYGARYIRMAAGDPGFLSGLVKGVSKVVGTVSKIPVLGKVATMIPGVGTVLGVASIAGSLAGPAGKALQTARAVLGGSKVTKGALSLGGGAKFPSRPGIGPVAGYGTALAAGAGLATGVATVAQKRRARRPATSPSARRSSRTRTTTSRSTRCGCKPGTRKVCFKSRRTGGARTAAQKRFAAASRRHGGRIPKGAKL